MFAVVRTAFWTTTLKVPISWEVLVCEWDMVQRYVTAARKSRWCIVAMWERWTSRISIRLRKGVNSDTASWELPVAEHGLAQYYSNWMVPCGLWCPARPLAVRPGTNWTCQFEIPWHSGFDTKFRHVRSIKAYERTKSHGYVDPETDYVGLGRHTKMYAVYVWETLERQGRDTLMVKLFTKFVISSSIHTKSRNFGGPIQGPIVMRMDGWSLWRNLKFRFIFQYSWNFVFPSVIKKVSNISSQ